MGFLSRVFLPRSVRRAMHPIRSTKRAIRKAVVPKPVSDAGYAVRRVANPVQAASLAVENAAVRAVKGGNGGSEAFEHEASPVDEGPHLYREGKRLMPESMIAWDDPRWAEESDNEWTAGCRWLQSWWRETWLQQPAGERTKSDDRRVASMLPLGADSSLNFLSDGVWAAVQDRLSSGDSSGIIAKDRLFRNLLSSQPMTFNLFGPFVGRPGALLPWVHSIDPDATSVEGVRFEWAPDPDRHFGGGSAFDAFVRYQVVAEPRFLGIECKYAENLSNSGITVREVYRDWTTPEHGWRDGASEHLDIPRLRQFWLNTLLMQSLREREGSEYGKGTEVIVACADDDSAMEAARLVQGALLDESQIRWSSCDAVVEMTDDPMLAEWAEAFRRRYLDFGPVSHKLLSQDYRLHP